jgi:hypothetical protein
MFTAKVGLNELIKVQAVTGTAKVSSRNWRKGSKETRLSDDVGVSDYGTRREI